MLIEPGKSYGFFTDTTVCIGCKACEVACKEWNNLPADNLGLTGQSYDNTGALSANTWRHVAFVEKSAAALAMRGRLRRAQRARNDQRRSRAAG